MNSVKHCFLKCISILFWREECTVDTVITKWAGWFSRANISFSVFHPQVIWIHRGRPFLYCMSFALVCLDGLGFLFRSETCYRISHKSRGWEGNLAGSCVAGPHLTPQTSQSPENRQKYVGFGSLLFCLLLTETCKVKRRQWTSISH